MDIDYGKIIAIFLEIAKECGQKANEVYVAMVNGGYWKIAIAIFAVMFIAMLLSFRSRIIPFIAAHKKAVATVAVGHTFNQIFDWIFNYPLYMLVIEKFGFGQGYVVMAIISFFTCLAFIRFYDWLKVDWLGIEVAKEVKDFGPGWIKSIQADSLIGKILWWPFSKIIIFILWAINKGGFIAFMALSIYTDPFIVTVYMRKGWGEYNGLSRKDWYIFFASTLVSNAYWAIRTFAILETVKFIWRTTFS